MKCPTRHSPHRSHTLLDGDSFDHCEECGAFRIVPAKFTKIPRWQYPRMTKKKHFNWLVPQLSKILD